VHEATFGLKSWCPEQEPHDHKPHALEENAHRAYKADQEASGPANSHEGCSQRNKDQKLQQEVVLAFWSHVISGVKVDKKKLLCKGYGCQQMSKLILSFAAFSIKNYGKDGIDQERHGHGGVFKVVEMGGGNGSIRVKWLVMNGSNEELHGNEDGAACHDEVELQVSGYCGGKP